MQACPKCGRPIKNPNAWHYCAEVSIDSLFEGKPPELELIFDKILAEVALWEGVEVSASKNCVVFVHRQTFLLVRPMAKELDLKFFLPEKHHYPPVKKIKQERKKWAHHIRLRRLDELTPEVFRLIRQSKLKF